MQPDEEFDVIVIGSGIGGLSAARMFAEFGGKRVLVLEQHYTLGGMMHEFTRLGRYHFGTGVHYLTSGPSLVLNYLADGQAQFQRLPDDYDILHFPGFDFAVPGSEAEFRARLKARFPQEAGAVDGFFTAVGKASRGVLARHIASALPAPLRAISLPVIERLYLDVFRTIKQVVARHFTDPALRAIVSARWGLYGPPPSVSAFGGHAIVGLEGFTGGATHPVGGPKALSQAIIEGIERFGVVLRPRQRVLHVVIERGRATGVVVEDGLTRRHYTIAAPCIVSAIGARNTSKLLDGANCGPWVRELAKLPREIGTLMLFIGFDKSPAAFGLEGENHWFMPDLDDDRGISRPLGDGILFASFSSLNNPAARAHTAEVMHFVEPEVFQAWFGTEEGARPEQYERLKAEVTERLLDRLEARWPGFRASVAFAELATPLSFMTYQSSAHGAFYGLANSPERLRSPIASCRTNIKGLYLSGQDACSPGVEAALWGGIMTANAALKGSQSRKMWRAIRLPVTPDPALPWRGYMRVSQIEELTPSVRRIRIEPLHGGDLPFRFSAGQYAKLDLPIMGEPIERSYSISSAPGERDFFDIAVKREEWGLGSAFLHDDLAVGDALRLSAPFGEFTLDVAREPGAGRLLLIAGGVGMTPILSVLAAAAEASHPGPITLLASFRSEADVLFAKEIEAFKRQLPGLDVSIHVTAAGVQPGRIGLATLQPLAADTTRVHLCGPAPMMQSMIGALVELGIARDAIHTEAFVSSQSRKTLSENAQMIRLMAKDAGIGRFQIGMQDAAAFTCLPGETLLAAANRAAVPFGQSCREGACGKCRARVLSGSILTGGQALFSKAEIADGWVLACQTLPQDDLEISLVSSSLRPALPFLHRDLPGPGAATARP